MRVLFFLRVTRASEFLEPWRVLTLIACRAPCSRGPSARARDLDDPRFLADRFASTCSAGVATDRLVVDVEGARRQRRRCPALARRVRRATRTTSTARPTATRSGCCAALALRDGDHVAARGCTTCSSARTRARAWPAVVRAEHDVIHTCPEFEHRFSDFFVQWWRLRSDQRTRSDVVDARSPVQPCARRPTLRGPRAPCRRPGPPPTRHGGARVSWRWSPAPRGRSSRALLRRPPRPTTARLGARFSRPSARRGRASWRSSMLAVFFRGT